MFGFFDPFSGGSGGSGDGTTEKVRYTIETLNNGDKNSFKLKQSIDGAESYVGDEITFSASDITYNVEYDTIDAALNDLFKQIGQSTSAKSIVSIVFTSSTGGDTAGIAGAIDTYTINYTDNSTDTFLVKNGENGITPIFNVTDSAIQISTNNGISYTDLIQLSTLKGIDGRELELQASGTTIQWRYVGEESWNDLINIPNINGGKTDYGEVVVSEDAITILKAVGKSNSVNNGEIFNNYNGNVADGDYSHAEGTGTQSIGLGAHAEGGGCIARGDYSHAEGTGTTASGFVSHVEGGGCIASKTGAHAEGSNSKANGQNSHAEGSNSEASGEASHAEGGSTQATGSASHSEGANSIAGGDASHAEGGDTQATGNVSHAEGANSIASEEASHAEGSETKATAPNSHSEGRSTNAGGEASHAEGQGTTASGAGSHAEGGGSRAVGISSHAEGGSTQANGEASHSEGNLSIANGNASHAEGMGTIANGEASHAMGKYNIKDDNDKYAFIIGNGTSDDDRSNALTVDWNGNIKVSGDVIATNEEGDEVSLTEISLLSGQDGKSAYEIAVENGFVGTEEEWLASLKGADGTSITIKDDLVSTDELPSSNQTIGDCYLINGNLWVYTNSSDEGAINGFIDAGNIQGPAGKNGKEVELQVADDCIQWKYNSDITWTNLISLSDLKGAQGENGVSITDISFTSSTGGDMAGIAGATDTYTITLSNETETMFNVTNGTGFSGNYEDLSNKPSIPIVTNDLTNELKTQYDEAYELKHTHSNKDVLDKLSDTDGALIYNGDIIYKVWSGTKEEYDSLDTKYDDWTYIITDEGDGAEIDDENTSNMTTWSSQKITNTIAQDLVNYYTKDETYTQEEIDQRISAIPKFSISVVTELPESDINSTTVYLITHGEGEGSNLYTEYIYVNGQWEKLGVQTLDLSDYYDSSTIDNLLNNKVDKETGKGLSSNDFSNEFKTKLEGIAENATRTIIDNSLSDTSTNPVQNKVINTALEEVRNSTIKKVKINCPQLASSDGKCVWSCNHGLTLTDTAVLCDVYTAEGEKVLCDIVVTSLTTVTITIISDTTISAGSYYTVIIG